jgi:preprotein translocase subunit SecE
MPPTKAPATTNAPARQAPKSRTPRPLTTAGGQRVSLGGRGQGISNTFRELRGEVRKVVWPTRREAANMTGVVLAIAAALGVFLGSVDFIFSELFRQLLSLTGAGGY